LKGCPTGLKSFLKEAALKPRITGGRLMQAARMKSVDEMIPTRQSLLSRLKDWNDQEGWKVFFDTRRMWSRKP